MWPNRLHGQNNYYDYLINNLRDRLEDETLKNEAKNIQFMQNGVPPYYASNVK